MRVAVISIILMALVALIGIGYRLRINSKHVQEIDHAKSLLHQFYQNLPRSDEGLSTDQITLTEIGGRKVKDIEFSVEGKRLKIAVNRGIVGSRRDQWPDIVAATQDTGKDFWFDRPSDLSSGIGRVWIIKNDGAVSVIVTKP